jgi:hypothetical protein
MRLGSVNFGSHDDSKKRSILFLNPGSKNTELKNFLQSNQPSQQLGFLPNIHNGNIVGDSSAAFIEEKSLSALEKSVS